jgi:hypothetical protein
MLVSLYMLVLVEIGVLILMVDLLNLLFTSFHILAHGFLLVISLWPLTMIHSYFTGLGTLILISCIASHSSLRLYLMSSLSKGERLCTKLVELLLIR